MAGVEGPLTNGVSRTNGALNGNGDLHDPIPQESPIAFDPSLFRSYLLSLLPPIFGASPEELESIFDDDFHERVSRFAGEGGGVIYVVKKKDEQECKLSLPSSFLSSSTEHSRGHATNLHLQAHSDADLRPLSCHDPCNHQTRPSPRFNIPFGYSTAYSQSIWER